MDATLAPVVRRVPVRGIELAIREWPGPNKPFLLVHGLASNARTWEAVARQLNQAGHHVVSVDQRGHGLSDKPDDGYDFASVTADLMALVEELAWQKPVLAGQSWGGNVVLEFAARYPEAAAGIVLVDGGFIDLSSGPEATWERISVDLKPPPLAGTPRDRLLEGFRSFQPDWTDEGVDNTLANFETLEDGTIRPWLTLDRHMKILRALWEQRPSEVYPHVTTPTLIAVARSPQDPQQLQRRLDEIARAETGLTKLRLQHFSDAAHDIHVHKPEELADWMLEALGDGFIPA